MTKAPNLILAGFQKCGSTFLARTLDAHPAICLAKGKEPNTFLRSNEDAYESEFKELYQGSDCDWRCDASINYAVSETACFRAAKWCPEDTRAIVVVRDPIARSLSGYLHLKKRYAERRSIHQVLAGFPETPNAVRSAEITSTLRSLQNADLDLFERIDPHDERWINALYVSNSLYNIHLDRWRMAFPNCPLKVVFFEELIASPDKVLGEIGAFLNIDGLDTSMMPKNPSNRTVLPPLISLESSVSRIALQLSKLASASRFVSPSSATMGDFSEAVVDKLYRLTRSASVRLFSELGKDWAGSTWNRDS